MSRRTLSSNPALATISGFTNLRNISGALTINANSALAVASIASLVSVQALTVTSNTALVNISFAALYFLESLNVNSNNANLNHVEFPLVTSTTGAVFVSQCGSANFSRLIRANPIVSYSCNSGLGNNYLLQNAVICIPCAAGTFGNGIKRSLSHLIDR